MTGKRYITILGLFLTSLTSPLSACSCFWVGDFCETIQYFQPENHSVFSLKILDKYVYSESGHSHIPMIDIQVLDRLAGPQVDYDTMTLVGQDGGNCAASFDFLETGDTVIVSIWNLADTTWRYLQPNSPFHINEINGCGIHHLLRKGPDLIQLNLDDTRDTLIYSNFISEFEDCTSLPLLTTSLRKEFGTEINFIPNPNFGAFNIVSEPGSHQIDYSIVNLAGQLFAQGTLSPSGNTEIRLENTRPGIYILAVRDGNMLKVYRMVIQ